MLYVWYSQLTKESGQLLAEELAKKLGAAEVHHGTLPPKGFSGDLLCWGDVPAEKFQWEERKFRRIINRPSAKEFNKALVLSQACLGHTGQINAGNYRFLSIGGGLITLRKGAAPAEVVVKALLEREELRSLRTPALETALSAMLKGGAVKPGDTVSPTYWERGGGLSSPAPAGTMDCWASGVASRIKEATGMEIFAVSFEVVSSPVPGPAQPAPVFRGTELISGHNLLCSSKPIVDWVVETILNTLKTDSKQLLKKLAAEADDDEASEIIALLRKFKKNASSA